MGAGVTDRAAVLTRAAQLAPMVSERAAECEAQRRVIDDVFIPLRDAHLCKLLLPATLGGLGLDPLAGFEVVETISRADGSTGWVMMILNGTLIAAWADPDAAREMTSGDDFTLAGMFGPLGKAYPDGDGFRVTGRWPFNSGSVNATWMLGGVFVMDGDAARVRDDGMPDWRFAMFPAEQATIHDTWRASGLRATASHDVSVDDIVVPAGLAPAPLFDAPKQPGTLSRFTFFAQLSCLMAGVPLGIARRALDEAVALSRTKSRGASPPLIEGHDVQNDLVRSESELRAARAFVVGAISDAWATAVAGEPLSADQRASIRLAASNAGRSAVSVVDRCFRIGGGGALYDHSPLQRCWRDIHAATHHIFFSDDHLREVGGLWLGLRDDSPLM